MNNKFVAFFVVPILTAPIIFGQDALDQGSADGGKHEYLQFRKLRWTDSKEASRFLLESAKKGYPNACVRISDQVDTAEFPYKLFGETPEVARINLLKKARPDDTKAKWMLASYLRDGSQKIRNLSAARELMKEASEAMETLAWSDYAEMCFIGEGGSVNHSEAYFYFSADAAVTAPSSPAGQETWKRREEAVEKLSKEKAIETLRKLDKWFAKNGRPALTISGTVPPEQVRMVNEKISRLEKKHRSKLGFTLESGGEF